MAKALLKQLNVGKTQKWMKNKEILSNEIGLLDLKLEELLSLKRYNTVSVSVKF